MTAPEQDRLVAIARWDGEAVRSGVAVLSRVAEGIPSWRARVEEVGRRLEAGAWSGPAGGVAARSVLVLSGVTTAVTRGLADSLAACRALAPTAGSAAALAHAALAAGHDPGAGGTPALGPPALEAPAHQAPAHQALAQEALAQAVRVAEALEAARAALSGLGVRDAFGPADFADLAARIPPLDAVPSPPSLDPDDVAAWWAGLPALARRALLQQRPALAGALDGLPAWARDRANRLLLARALHRRSPSPTARAVAAELTAREAAGETVQLHLFDEAGERVAVVLGDADLADALALLVPGIATTPDDDLDAVTADVARAAAAARAAGAGAVAGVAWLGYQPPQAVGILFRRRAEQAGPVLAAALEGLAATRVAGEHDPARTTVIAHSYGTVVVDEAADAPGRLAANAVVLLGSPGMEPEAASLEVAEVYDAASAADPISWAGWFGRSPWAAPYGAVELPVAQGTGHSEYLDADRPTLAAVGGVVAGTGGPP